MVIVYILILVLLIVLKVCAKISKPVLPVSESSYSKVFLPEAALICSYAGRIPARSTSWRLKTGKGSIKDRRILKGLQTLYPGEAQDSLYYRYRVEMVSTILLIVCVGTGICLVLYISSMSQGVLQDGDVIYRSFYGGTEIEADLSAGIIGDGSEDEYPVDLMVSARTYSPEEADAIFERMSSEIDSILLGENDSPEHVIYPVSLVKTVDGYPFVINWECSNYELVDYDGVVHNENLTGPVIVTLTGDCAYEHDHRYLIRDLQICPKELTQGEMIREEILAAVDEADKKSTSKEALTLPDKISYGSLQWTEHIEDYSPLILFGILLIACFSIPFKESEINGRLKKRARELLIEYPAFVSQLTLYLGAGMSVRNCILRLGRRAYERKETDKTCLDRELIISAHELEMGIAENEVVERFGKRCGTREYMRFSTLLTQNMKKGSTDLMAVLREEADDAFILRKNEARKLGEEASTKLLLPMVMMLTVVMIIIMVPAYMSFSS